MIVVVTAKGERVVYPAAARFLTEEVFNNLVLQDKRDQLLAVFAQDQWERVEVDGGAES